MTLRTAGMLIGLLFTTPYMYAGAVAKVLFAQNKVIAKSVSGERSLSRGASLSVGDSIITPAKGMINFKYSNGTMINLGENSHYTILAYAPKQSDVQVKANLSQGKLKFETTGKSKEEITTPVAALAILGTIASVYVSSPTSTYVQVTQGVVQVKEGSVKAGDSALINQNGLTHTPFPTEGEVSAPMGTEGSIAGAVTNTTDTPLTTTNNDTTVTLTTMDTTGASTGNTVGAGTEVLDLAIACIP